MAKELAKLKEFDLRVSNPKALLYGNGLCISNGKKSTYDLIEKIREKYSNETGIKSISEIAGIPFSMRVVVASNNKVDEVCKDLHSEMTKETYYQNLNTEILDEIAKLDMDAYLTTNYSYEFEYSLDNEFLSKKNKYATYTDSFVDDKNKPAAGENKFQLHSFYRIEKNGKMNDIWHLHGEAFNASSIVLGHENYGNLISKYENDLNKNKLTKRNGKLILKPQSWLDYFIYGDVSIVGFGYNLAETDLWWLLDKKYHIRKEYGLNNKTVMYIPEEKETTKEIAMLLRAYEVEICITQDINKKYSKHYLDSISKIDNE